MPDQKSYLHQSIAQAVIDHGITTMFGLMGDGNLFMANHFVRECGGTFVPAAFEGGSVQMALAYTHVSGEMGVATVTHGPGLTNCVTALTEGVRGRRPMVLLAGDTPVSAPEHPQNIDQRELVKVTGAGFVQIGAPETATRDIAEAFYRARVEKRPIVLNMPIDFMWVEIEHTKTVFPYVETPAVVTEGPEHEKAIGIIASAKRPLILAGAGAVNARDKLIALAERMEAPLATTLKAKGLFNGHPNNMDIFGTLSTPDAYDVIASADCVVAFGAWLHFFTTDKGALLNGKRVVQVNNDPSEIGAFYRPDAVLVADAGLTADNILYWLDEAEIPPSGFARELDPVSLSKHPPGDPDKTTEGFINYEYALDRLNEALPEDRILATDGGRFVTEVWCRVATPDPRSLVLPIDFAAIGQGLQEAIGAAYADPDRPVVLFTGDGGFMLGGVNEFNTAVRTKRDLIVIVCNDAAYGAEHIQFKDRDLDPGLSQFDWPSFVEIAKAFGGNGIQVRSATELETAIDAIANRDGPLLIELKLDPNAVPRMRL